MGLLTAILILEVRPMIALIHMRIPRSLLIVMCVTAPGAAIAQGPACPGGRASTATRLDTWVEPHAREVVAQQVFKSITELGYTFADTTGPYVTAPKFSWPTNSTFPLWRSLVYPGATLTIAVDTAGPWSRVRLETRLACDTDQRPPPGFPPDVDFQTFVVTETHDAAWRAIVSPLHRLKVRTFAQSCAPLPEGDDNIAVCRQMAKADPPSPDALRQYVLALARFYHVRDAWKAFAELVALEGERASTYGEVARAMLDAGQFEDALKLSERATVLWPADAKMAYQLGRARLGLHQLEPAAEAFAAAIAHDSSLADTHTYAAVTATKLDRPDEARQHCATARRFLEAALADRAADVDAWLGLAYCASVFDHDREAVSYFARARAISASRAGVTSELVDLIRGSYAVVGDQPPAPVPDRK